MGDVTTTLRLIACDGCDFYEEIRSPDGAEPVSKFNWATVRFDESGPPRMYPEGAVGRPLEPRTYCPDCIERAINKLDELPSDFHRLRGGKAPKEWP